MNRLTRFYPKAHANHLAQSMWGKVIRRIELKEGIWLYTCGDYQGIVVCDLSFRLHPYLKQNYPSELTFLRVLEGDRYFYVADEDKLPLDQVKKTIRFFAFEADALALLFYYHDFLLEEMRLQEMGKQTEKERDAFLRGRRKQNFRAVVMNYPQFVKKRDVNRALNLLNRRYEQYVHFENRLKPMDSKSAKLLKAEFEEKKKMIKMRNQDV